MFWPRTLIEELEITRTCVVKHTKFLKHVRLFTLGLEVIKLFFILNSAEREIFSANKRENANKTWHFYIYSQRNFYDQLYLARKNLQLLVIWDLLPGQISCSAELNVQLSWAWKKFYIPRASFAVDASRRYLCWNYSPFVRFPFEDSLFCFQGNYYFVLLLNIIKSLSCVLKGPCIAFHELCHFFFTFLCRLLLSVNTIQYNTIQYNTIQYNTNIYSALNIYNVYSLL